jgi:hypothetical protein
MDQPASESVGPPRIERDRNGLPGVPAARRITRVIAAAVLFALYAFGQPWHLRGDIEDVQATTLPAWHVVETGTWDLSDYREVNPWFVEVPNGVWTNRTPGVVAVAVVGYFVTAPFTDGFENWPGTLIAITTAWLAVLVVAAISERLRPGTWLTAVAVFGLGTATWGVAAEQLWPHGPAQLAIAISVWLLIRHRTLLSGIAMAAAVLIRPPVLIIGVGLAVVRSVNERSLKPLLTMGVPSLAAGAAYLSYNRILFGSWSPVAAYEAVGGFVGQFDFGGIARNVTTAFFGPSYGLLIWSPWIAVALFGLFRIRHLVPRWMMYTPLVAAAYITLHSVLEIASGALFFNYRYQLEAVALAAPILIVAIPDFDETRAKRLVMGAAITVSILLQVLFVFVSSCWINDSGAFTCALIP